MQNRMTSGWTDSPIALCDAAAARVKDRSVLVTGAGGSIGSALARALGSCEPERLLLLDHSEVALYELKRRSEEQKSPANAEYVLGSVCDEALLRRLFLKHRPEIVFHTAAYKHVPMLERNPFAAIADNVFGAVALLEAAVEHGVRDFVQISTDKAVEPQSMLGASKRVVELLLIAMADGGTRSSAVRLGNVWGSQGSVVALFLEQIARGGPLTVSDPGATRYFMSMGDAVRAIAAALAPRHGGTVLVPELGPPTRIVDLATRLLREHNSAAPVCFTGLRPGDKLSEALLSRRECLLPAAEDLSGSPLRVVLSPAPALAVVLSGIAELRRALAAGDLAALLEAVCRLVPEYTPSALLRTRVRQDDRIGRI